MNLGAAVRELRAEAAATDRRRLLVVHGDYERCLDAAYTALSAWDADEDAVSMLTTHDGVRFEQFPPRHADKLLGTTREAVVFDGFEEFSPNALGQTLGTVEGGGLYVLLLPSLSEWIDRHDDFRTTLAVPPFEESDVSGAFRERLVETISTHHGVSVYDADADELERDGLTGERSSLPRGSVSVPRESKFPEEAYEACLTADQGRTLADLEALADRGEAVVVEADRGRGKSSVAGLAAGSLALDGRRVFVTAPERESTAALFERASELVESAVALLTGDENLVETEAGGEIRFLSPTDLVERLDGSGAAGRSETAERPDAVIVDEAAALPVRLLERTLAARSVAFVTTVHGYEGTGRGFAVRFRDRLAESSLAVTDSQLTEPIRYAPDDPVESWGFRALLLDARPPVGQLVADADPGNATYRHLTTEELRADAQLLREVFGLLVLAHYRTEPNDLARMLDAPNLSVHALFADGNVVSVALVAREGGLSAERRREMIRGGRLRGNMVPDLLTGQLRDPEGATPVGYRVVRIATHDAVRRSGFGTSLLDGIHDDFAGAADYFSTGFGATPGLVDFWKQNGYQTVHISTTRNDASGEHSAIMLRPESAAGTALVERHSRQFRDRIGGVLADSIRDLDPDVTRAVLSACAADGSELVELSEYDWRMVVGAASGPGLYATAPRPFQKLALAWLIESDSDEAGEASPELSPRAERLLVRKVLQAQSWETVATELDYDSTGQCMRAFGETCQTLVDRFGGAVAMRERERYE
jgi:tRNA(Met) cytidine acetyltransferase